MTTTPDTHAPEPIDPATVPTELREQWLARAAAQLAAYAGVTSQSRKGTTRWMRGLGGPKVVAWRKRGVLYVATGRGSAADVSSQPGVRLTTWGQLEALVAGLVPAIPRRVAS